MTINLRIFLLIFCLFPITGAIGQDLSEKKFTAYSTAQGLSDNTITGIAQDPTGYIWLTTLNGVNRFNGSRFIQYHSTKDSSSLAAEETNGITWLDHDRLAVYTAGLHIINTKTGETRNLFIPYHNRQYEYKFNMIVAAIGDEQGNVFILSRSGFYHFDKYYRLVSRFDYYTEEQVPKVHFFFGRELMLLDDRRLLLSSIDGLYIYDKEKRKVKKMGAADSPLLAEFLDYPNRNYKFLQAKAGELFVLKLTGDTIVYINPAKNLKTISRLPVSQTATEFGWRSKAVAASDTVLYITGQSSGFYKVRFYPRTGAVNLSPEKYFRSSLVNTLLTDKDKNLWVATTKGLFRQDNIRSYVETAYLPAGLENTFADLRINAVCATAGEVYAGARLGAGLFIYNKKTFQFEKRLVFENYNPVNNNNSIHKILAISPTEMMLGTGGYLFFYDEKTGRQTKLDPPGWAAGDWTNELYRDSRGSIWIASRQIYRYDRWSQHFTTIPVPQSMPVIPVAFYEDLSGHIWVAGHGITRYNSVLQKFDEELDSFPAIKMPDKQVSAMIIDPQNTIWFGSGSNGLIAYNIDKKTYRHFTRANGLPDDNLSSMIVIGKKLWIACYSGIACLDLQTEQIKNFGKEDGFPDMPVMKGSRFFYDSSMHQLYLGFYSAVVRFNPDDLLGIQNTPSVFIENLNISNGNTYLPGNTITTSWKNKDLMITIGSINFQDGNNMGYAYRVLSNADTTWQQLGTQSSFSISNLEPGNHRIQVKIFSLNNRWPEQVKEINISVTPPFWQTVWFKTLAVILLLILLYVLVKWRSEAARKKEMEKTNIQKLKADDYKSQFELEQISNYFSSSLADKKTENDVLWDVAGNLIGRMNYEDCMIYLWNEGKTKMIQKAAYGPKGDPESISSDVFDVLPGQGVVGHVVKTMQPVLVRDTRKDSRYRIDDAFRLSEVCVPIIHDNELLGVIDSEHHEPDYFKERDIKILTTIATLIGNKLKQLESEQTLEVKQQELTNINEQLAEAKLSALQAQMNPHFIFNALNSIKRMILDGDNERASRYLSKFALMIRMTLNHSKDIFVTLRENVEYLKTYLEMEQLRFEDSFTWNIEVAENIDVEEVYIPSLMIQPLVENAIWHGLLQSDYEKRLSISFTCDQNRVTVIIQDNGIGIRQSEKNKKEDRSGHRSVGLENLKNRIKIMNEKYETNCTLAITDIKETTGNGNGTKAELSFNIINN